jgi:hypothetical protein
MGGELVSNPSPSPAINQKIKFIMNIKTIIAALLIALGTVVLAYSGLSFTTPGKPIEFLGMHITTINSHFIPPAAGALALVGGIVLLLVKPRSA